MTLPPGASRLIAEARRALDGVAFPEAGVERPRTGVAWAPGRCTLVGEHVDYAGGQVACVAIDLGVAVAVRPSPDGAWRVASELGAVTRTSPDPVGDLGDRVFAVPLALGFAGISVPAIDVSVAATLPAGAGLASSAALACAVTGAVCCMLGRRLRARELATVALRAERDVVGVPVGPLDQIAIVEAPAGGALILDCATGGTRSVPWPWPDGVLVACDTGIAHDVAGEGYRTRREEVARGLEILRVRGCQEADLGMLAAAALPEPEHRRMRHVITETRRTEAAAEAMRGADLGRLGALMDESHASLRNDAEVSTAELDRTAEAARAMEGCAGARLVGAGFGGSVVALVSRDGAEGCAAAMVAAAGDRATARRLEISAGMASACPDVVADG